MMDISVISDTMNVASQGLGFANLLHRQNYGSHSVIAISDSTSADQSAAVLHISAAIFNALAPPPVKSNRYKTARRTLLRKKRRTRRRSYGGGDSEEGGEEYGFFGGGDGDDGPFGGRGGGWGGGRGWNFDGFGGQNWDESSWRSSSSSNFAYGFVYEVIYWIALSNCVHFTFKKFVRIIADGIGDAEREKVPMRLNTVC